MIWFNWQPFYFLSAVIHNIMVHFTFDGILDLIKYSTWE